MDNAHLVQRPHERAADASAGVTAALPRTGRRRWHLLLAPMFGLCLLAGWALVAGSGMYAAFIVPSPASVAERWWGLASDGSLIRHAAVTLREVLTGLVIGVAVAFWLGYWIAKSRAAFTLTPYLALWPCPSLPSPPADHLVWLRHSQQSIICADRLLPHAGQHGDRDAQHPPELHDLLRSLEATPLQTFWHLGCPLRCPSSWVG